MGNFMSPRTEQLPGYLSAYLSVFCCRKAEERRKGAALAVAEGNKA
jgi:hypothetical protein